jgi:hypothetical protein
MSDDKNIKKNQRRRSASPSTPEATIIKNNQMSQGLSPKLGAASASSIKVQSKAYAPQWLDSSLNMPRDIRTINAWNRAFFVTNPLVRSAITLHASYTASKFKLVCKDRKIKQFFDDMLAKMDFQNALLEIGIEFWKLGEVFANAELDENNGTWQYINVMNPDFIHVLPPNPLQRDPVLTLVPDEALKRIVTSPNPLDRALREQIPPEIILHIQKGEPIPLDNFNVSHLKMLSSPYDTRGTSIITSCYRDLMLYDKIREAKIVQADNFMNPLTLVKLGSENYKPTDDDIRQWQEQVLDSVGDQGYTIVTHGLVDIVKISNSGQTLDMNADLESTMKNIMIGLMVPTGLFDTDYGSYSNGSVGLQVLKDRYKNFQLQLKKWIEKKILEPIAKIQEFYTIEGGEEKLIVPTVEFEKIALKEADSFINALSNHVGDPKEPGSGKVSTQTFLELFDVDYEAEKGKLRLEARDAIIRKKEVKAMEQMDIEALKTLNEYTPIQDPGEITSLEKSLDIDSEVAENSEGADAGGDLGGGDLGGGDFGGGDLGGDLGGGGEASAPDLGGEAAPEGGGAEPPPSTPEAGAEPPK